jgi:hypothetical protein
LNRIGFGVGELGGEALTCGVGRARLVEWCIVMFLPASRRKCFTQYADGARAKLPIARLALTERNPRPCRASRGFLRRYFLG